MLWKIFDESLAGTEDPALFGWPAWSELEQNHLYAYEGVVETISEQLTTQRIHLLAGPEGRGKSTLASIIAFNRFRNQLPVHVVVCPAPGEEPDYLAAAIKNRDQGVAPLWIFEDCHATTDALDFLRDSLLECKKTQFLFVCRTISPKLFELKDSWPFKDLERSRNFTFLQPNAEVVRGVIESYLISHTSKVLPGRRSKALVTDEDINWALQTTGGDLRTLKSFLDTWEPGKEALEDLRIEAVYDRLINTKFRPLAKVEYLSDTYARLCAIFQFEVQVFGTAFRLEKLEELRQRGLIGLSWFNTYVVPHTSDARLAVAAYCRMMGKDRRTFISDCIEHYFSSNLPRAYAARFLTGLATNRSVVQFEVPESLREKLAIIVFERGDALVVARYIRLFCRSRGDLQKWLSHLTLNRSDIDDVRALLAEVKKIDAPSADKIDNNISLKQRISLNARAAISSIAWHLYHYQRNANSAYFARQVLAETIRIDFQERIRRTNAGAAGRLLYIAREIDPEMAKIVATVVADQINFVRRDNAEDLSLLLDNIRFGEEAWCRLISRVIEQANPSGLLESSPKGYSYLLSHMGQFLTTHIELRTVSRRFFGTFAEEIDGTMLAEIGCKQLNWTIWNFLVVGEDPSPWLLAKMQDLIRLFAKGDIDVRYWLCWNLLQVEEGLFRNFVRNGLVNTPSEVIAGSGVAQFALVGLLLITEIDLELGQSILDDTLISQLCDDNNVSTILFALRAINAKNPEAYAKVLLQLRSKSGNFRNRVEDLIASNPLPRSRQLLSFVLNALPGL